jgi:ABC-2 type transport system ATP-binding protein
VSELAIHTVGLRREFGAKAALAGLDLALGSGKVHALVGANGAGKSTLFHILLGFLAPTSGEARILGTDCRALDPALRARIGYVNEEHTLPDWLGVSELRALDRALYPRWDQPTFDEVLSHFRIGPHQPVGKLSRGERAGVSLALALARRPELLILDEPTLGLDGVAKRAFLEALLFLQAGGAQTTVYCSHQMDEAERVAEELVILDRGRVVCAGTPESLCERVRAWVAEIPFRGPSPDEVLGLLDMRQLDGLCHCTVLDQGEDFAEFSSSPSWRTRSATPSRPGPKAGASRSPRAARPIASSSASPTMVRA